MSKQSDNVTFLEMIGGLAPVPVHPNPGFFETTEVRLPGTRAVKGKAATRCRTITHAEVEQILATPYGMDRVLANLAEANLEGRTW